MVEQLTCYFTSTLGACNVTTGLSTGCVTLYAPGPGVIKLGAGKRLVFKRKRIGG